MPSKRIEAPGKGKNVSTEEAARWLGVSEDSFERLAKSSGWLTPVRIGRRLLWDSLDVAVLAHVVGRTGEGKTVPGTEKLDS